MSVVDIPFELVGKIASAGAVAEAGNVESLATARHVCWMLRVKQGRYVCAINLATRLQNQWSSSGRCDDGGEEIGDEAAACEAGWCNGSAVVGGDAKQSASKWLCTRLAVKFCLLM